MTGKGGEGWEIMQLSVSSFSAMDISAQEIFGLGFLEPLPEAVEVGEVDGLPEPAEPAVTDPAGDGQCPPHHHDCSHAVNPFVIAPARHREGQAAEASCWEERQF